MRELSIVLRYAAAQRYFGKKAGSLNLAEAAMLAGLIRSPTQLAPTRNLEGARRLYERAGFRVTETKTGLIWGAERTEMRMEMELGAAGGR